MQQQLNPQLPQPHATQVERVRYLMQLLRKTQAQFAMLIGLDPSNLSRALNNGEPLRDSFVNRVVVNVGVARDWLVTGKGLPFPKGEHATVLTDAGRRIDDCDPQAPGAPVYDIDVTAGSRELSQMFTHEHIIGHFDMPGINPDCPIVRVSGDSMTPRISNGAYISIRPLSDSSPIFWGQIYVVVLEDYRLVKYVRRHSDPSMVILHSDNPAYDDMEVSRRQIVKLYMVESILNYDIVG